MRQVYPPARDPNSFQNETPKHPDSFHRRATDARAWHKPTDPESLNQVYLPNLSTEVERVHQHYLKQGIGHTYTGPDGKARMYGNEKVREKPEPR